VEEGELLGLIGPNGAGKTTVFNLTTGVYRPASGEIHFQGRRLDRMAPHQIAQSGIARTFQNLRVFSGLSVLDNVKVGLMHAHHYGLTHALAASGTFRRAEVSIEREALNLLELFQLRDKADIAAENLPYGDQRRLEIARALATRPKVLLLDEPAAGMNTAESAALMNLIRWLREEFALTILLIEHDMRFVMGICERIVVLDHGEVIAVGPPGEIRKNAKVIEAYLGTSEI